MNNPDYRALFHQTATELIDVMIERDRLKRRLEDLREVSGLLEDDRDDESYQSAMGIF